MTLSNNIRDPKLARQLLENIRKLVTRPWVIMEICGGQTHAIMSGGLDQLLPGEIELVHGPGCPVCVTALEQVDQAIEIASKPDVIFTSYGDMLRVPGSSMDLMTVRAEGGDVRTVYSPLDAVKLATQNPEKQVVFFGIGFETTAPANAMSVMHAQNLKLENFSVLVSQVRVPPAMEMLLMSPHNRVQGFLAAGHVCSVMGYWEYVPISRKFQIPIVVTGFELVDILIGIQLAITQLEKGQACVENGYERWVSLEGNLSAQENIKKVYENCDKVWRGIGMIPNSGWRLRPEYAQFDALKRFQVDHIVSNESKLCIAGEILQGIKKPIQCSAFGKQCTPQSPLGATMVSSEGACAAYYKYAQHEDNRFHEQE
jgi:hydrogenase expression/formation protein HypD